jgi:hypothetical protein
MLAPVVFRCLEVRPAAAPTVRQCCGKKIAWMTTLQAMRDADIVTGSIYRAYRHDHQAEE